MENLSSTLTNDLFLTKALENNIGKLERWDSLDSIVDELFENGALDRESYLHSIMELTQSGYIESDIEEEEDIKLSEMAGYDIQGLTPKGKEYIDSLLHEPAKGEKIKQFFKKVDEACDSFVESGVGKLVLPLLGLFI